MGKIRKCTEIAEEQQAGVDQHAAASKEKEEEGRPRERGGGGGTRGGEAEEAGSREDRFALVFSCDFSGAGACIYSHSHVAILRESTFFGGVLLVRAVCEAVGVRCRLVCLAGLESRGRSRGWF